MTQAMLIFGAGLFCFGMLGFLTRRNLILMFLSLEMMLAGVSLNFITFGNQYGDLGGQTFSILILTVAACEAALALSLVVVLVRSRGSLDVEIWQVLKELSPSALTSKKEAKSALERKAQEKLDRDNDDAYGYGELPKLTPAGLDPLQHPIDASPDHREPASRA